MTFLKREAKEWENKTNALFSIIAYKTSRRNTIQDLTHSKYE